MRKFLLSTAMVAVIVGTPAEAAVLVSAPTVINLNNPNPSTAGSVQTVDGVTSINFGLNPIAGSSFTSSFIINNTLAGIYTVAASTSTTGVIFTGGTLTQLLGCAMDFTGCTNGTSYDILVGTGPTPPAGMALYLGETQLTAGNYRVTINGTGPGYGSYTGEVTIRPAVPEPGTWAMMLLGFGATGLMLRRRRQRPATLAQVA